MRLSTKLVIFFDRLKRRLKKNIHRDLYQTAGLIRREAREKMYMRGGASSPGSPPHAHVRNGLKEINFHVLETSAYIGPRKFPRSNFFNRPVPNIHEKGGMVLSYRAKRTLAVSYKERSFMYSAVKRLAARGKLKAQFSYILRSF
jgi:hypothetical protein